MKKAEKIILTTVGLAAALGISRQRVNELGRLAKITREPDERWDLAKVRSQLRHTLDNSQPWRSRIASPPAGDLPESDLTLNNSVHEIFNRARAAKEVAGAKEAQLDLRAREGELLERDEVKTAWTEGMNAFRSQLLLVPDRLAPKVAVCANVRECRALIEEEMHKALGIFSETQTDVA